MLDMNIVESITERDIDMLILEEFNISDSFANWFYSKCLKETTSPKLVKAWHSVSDPELGESDLIAIYENNHAILIENKIDAIVQQNQAARYHLRGEKGIKDGLWNSFTTCMIAPELYLNKTPDSKIYDIRINYEDFIGWYESVGDVRCLYRKYIIEQAIKQSRRGYTTIPDLKVTDFWEKYWLYISTEHKYLRMNKPGIKPSKSTFINLYAPNLSNGFSLVHKVDRGSIDLEIAGMIQQFDELVKLFADLDIEVVPAGKSVALRKKVNDIDVLESFVSQKNIVVEALHNAKILLEIVPEVQERLKSIIIT